MAAATTVTACSDFFRSGQPQPSQHVGTTTNSSDDDHHPFGPPRALLGHRGRCFAARFAPRKAGRATSRRLELATASEDETVRIWDVSSRTCIQVCAPRHSGGPEGTHNPR